MNSLVSLQQNVSNQFTFADAAKGIEVSGGHQYGGYHYSVAVVDQNTAGIDQSSNTSPYVPSATGGANGGVGFGSSSQFQESSTAASPTASTWSAIRKAGMLSRPPEPRALTTTPT